MRLVIAQLPLAGDVVSMSATGQKETLGELVSDVRFGAVSGLTPRGF